MSIILLTSFLQKFLICFEVSDCNHGICFSNSVRLQLNLFLSLFFYLIFLASTPVAFAAWFIVVLAAFVCKICPVNLLDFWVILLMLVLASHDLLLLFLIQVQGLPPYFVSGLKGLALCWVSFFPLPLDPCFALKEKVSVFPVLLLLTENMFLVSCLSSHSHC